MGTKHIKWNAEDDARLLVICLRNQTIGLNGQPCIKALAWREIASLMGRTERSCKDRFWGRESRADKMKYKPREKPKLRVESRRDAIRQQPSGLPTPSSLTAMVFGDPLPGRSALDKKMSAQQP